ncbi:MAG: hypothetical protein AB8F95_11420 [Bacteroidia bacterium]
MMKNIIPHLCLVVLCLVMAGCPVIDEACGEDRQGEACAGLQYGCVCIEGIQLNNLDWQRSAATSETPSFKLDDRNDNRISIALSDYDPAFGELRVRLSNDMNGDGTITGDEVFFEQIPDQNGVAASKLAFPSDASSLAQMDLDVLTADGGGICYQKLCVKAPNCYIQIGGGQTTACPTSVAHWNTWEGHKDCYFAEEDSLELLFKFRFDEALLSPGSTIEVNITGLEYVTTGTPLLTDPMVFSAVLEDAPVSGMIYTVDEINFKVFVDGSIGPGDFELCYEIIDVIPVCGVGNFCTEFELQEECENC